MQFDPARFASRKFIITASALVLGTAFLLTDQITGSDWTNIALASMVAYNLGNGLAGRR